MRWVAEQRDRGVRSEVPIRLHDTTGMLFLGDPGEMDASQYVLVRDLGLVANSLLGMGVDTALLMSDVVYPAGDVNQWADAVYLPYYGLPANAWAEAATKYAAGAPRIHATSTRTAFATGTCWRCRATTTGTTASTGSCSTPVAPSRWPR